MTPESTPNPDAGALLERYDRRIGAAFGGVIVTLMLAVFLVGMLVYFQSIEKERERLSTVIASTLQQALERISFSGRHHARLLVEQIASANEPIVYISIVGVDRRIVAHSDPARNGSEADPESLDEAMGVLEGGGRRLLPREVGGVAVSEVVVPLRGGYQDEPIGIVRIGVEVERTRTVLLRGVLMIGGLVLLLLGASIPLTQGLARRLGAPVKELASEFRGLMQHAPLHVVVQGRDGSVERVSAEFERRLGAAGVSPGALLETVAVGAARPDSVGAGEAEVALSVGGEERVFLASRFPLATNPDGTPERTCLVAADITARKRAQAENDRLATALQCVADLVLVTDAEGVITHTNPAFTEVTGWSREEAVGQRPSILKSGQTPDETYDELWETITRGGIWRGRLVNQRKSGEHFPCDLTVSAIRAPEGTIAAFVGLGRDVSREVALEEQLQHAQRLEAVGRLAGGIAHDFNNLLTVIVGVCSVLEMDERLPNDALDSVGTIARAGQRAAELTRQLLAFSRRQMLSLVPLDLGRVVADAGRLIGRVLSERIEVNLETDSGLWVTRADQGQMEQVLLNLAINARDAMEGEGRLTIRTENRSFGPRGGGGVEKMPGGDYVVLSVTDTGSGIAPDVLPHVFEPFFTTKQVGAGTGLGLSTVHGIVRQSGGYVWVESVVGEGTTFFVAMPRHGDKPVVEESAKKQVRERPDEDAGETLLVVEDQALVRNTLVELLRPVGYDVVTAENGVEALELLERSDRMPDLVLSDLVMPKMGGAELATRLRQLHPSLPVVFISGYSAAAVDVEDELGDIPLVSKPVSAAQLRSVVRKELERRR